MLYFRKRESLERRTEEKYRPEPPRSSEGIGAGAYRERNENRNERAERGRQSSPPRVQRQERERVERRLPVPELHRDRREDVNQAEWRGRDRAPGKLHGTKLSMDCL